MFTLRQNSVVVHKRQQKKLDIRNENLTVIIFNRSDWYSGTYSPCVHIYFYSEKKTWKLT